MIFHTANSYQEEDGTLVLEVQSYENMNKNPFDAVSFDKINDINKITDHEYNSKFKKISMNLKDGSINLENYMEVDNGFIDLPMFNPKYSGKKNCFTYVLHEWAPSTVDENYAFPIHKYDSCKGEIAATYNTKSSLP